jgi:hypothetical protein
MYIRKALITFVIYSTVLFSDVEQELHHFGGVGAKALTHCGSGSN